MPKRPAPPKNLVRASGAKYGPSGGFGGSFRENLAATLFVKAMSSNSVLHPTVVEMATYAVSDADALIEELRK